MIKIEESRSTSYVPRTYHNATKSDFTVAIAADFSSAGERLTKTAAAGKYVAIPLSQDPIPAARAIYTVIQSIPSPTINIAGNGIYTLCKEGWTQERLNAHVHTIFAKIHAYTPIKMIRTGGQTGVDLAGAIAGAALGIDVIVTMPRGFKQRGTDGVDRDNSRSSILAQINDAVRALQQSN